MEKIIKPAKFEVTNLESILPGNVVWRIFYTATLSENGKTVSADGFIGLYSKDPLDSDFVPYEQVTKEQAHNWMMDRLLEGEAHRVSEELTDKLASTNLVEIVQGTPWQTQE
jgi:hypothetical protein